MCITRRLPSVRADSVSNTVCVGCCRAAAAGHQRGHLISRALAATHGRQQQQQQRALPAAHSKGAHTRVRVAGASACVVAGASAGISASKADVGLRSKSEHDASESGVMVTGQRPRDDARAAAGWRGRWRAGREPLLGSAWRARKAKGAKGRIPKGRDRNRGE